ncbi:hypothetical protein [uncultured Kordia sp.]|nr:hypothetical protein [uncultured Kordia sp.]
MRLPNQTKTVAYKTYNANAVKIGANASAALTPMMKDILFSQFNL